MIMAAVCTSDTLTYFSEHLVDKLAALPWYKCTVFTLL
jgi:hypothetical protein